MFDLLRRNPRLRHAVARVAFGVLPRAVRFRLIYRLNLWGADARSGGGATLATTARLRSVLPGVLAELGVRRLVDVPCGDFGWLSTVPLDADYVGVDIVPELIAENVARYGSPSRRFIVADATRDPLPPGDAILCRFLLDHLSHEDGLRVLARCRESGARWLLATTFPTIAESPDIVTGDFRPVNLTLPPYSLPAPLRVVDDSSEPNPESRLGVWRLVG